MPTRKTRSTASEKQTTAAAKQQQSTLSRSSYNRTVSFNELTSADLAELGRGISIRNGLYGPMCSQGWLLYRDSPWEPRFYSVKELCKATVTDRSENTRDYIAIKEKA